MDLARLFLGLTGSTQPGFAATYTYGGQAESPDGKADIIDVVFSAYMPPDRVESAVGRFRTLYPEVAIEPAVLLPGAREAMEAVRELGGRIVVLSYHSLEDRITKRSLAAGATSSAPPGLPVELPEQQPWLRLLVRGAEQADAHEQSSNPRSASVRLRAAERTRPTPDQTPAARSTTAPREDIP